MSTIFTVKESIYGMLKSFLEHKQARMMVYGMLKSFLEHKQARMMVVEERNSNSVYIFPDLLEEIFLRLPLKSILKFKTVSKQWRSILESKMFVERRMKVKKSRKFLAAYNCDCGDRTRIISEARLEGDEVIVYLHCGDAQPYMTCDGLVCIPEPDSIIVLNPSTGQLLRFPTAADPVSSRFRNGEAGSEFYQGNWSMGFGRDKVTGSYKVTKMYIQPKLEGCESCDVLDVESGGWKKVRVPPYVVQVARKSVSVNGSIYWLSSAHYLMGRGCRILAFDLHKEDFHFVSVPANWIKQETQFANLEDRLTIANRLLKPDYILEICSMSAQEEIWTKIHSISLAGLAVFDIPYSLWCMSFMPLAVSKQGNLVFYNSEHWSLNQWLFEYYSDTHEVRCLSSNICVISLYLENLVPLRSRSGHHPDYNSRKSSCGFFTKHPEPFSKRPYFF